MITFKQYIAELFDSPIEYKLSVNRTNMNGDIIKKYSFAINDVEYTCSISYEIGKTPQYDIDFYANGSTSVTNMNKDQFTIYATVIKIVKNYFNVTKLKSGDKINMFASNRKMGPIYKRFATKFAEMYGGAVDDKFSHTGSYIVRIK